MDVATHSAVAHKAFEVAITVSRGLEAARSELAVLHLGSEEWHTHDSTKRPVQLDAVSVLASVDIKPGDVITVAASTGAVPVDSSWTVADRMIGDADRHIVTWRVTQQGDAV